MPERNALRWLAPLLAAKSLAELVFVATLSLGFYRDTFPPYLHGSIDEVNPHFVSGWAIDQERPDQRVEVQLYIDGAYASGATAQLPRPDVKNAGESQDGKAGFYLDVPHLRPGLHDACVYAMHVAKGNARTLLMVGKPVSFEVPDQR